MQTNHTPKRPVAEVLRLSIDHAKIGNGWRDYRVRKVGRKWARLEVVASGKRIKLPIAIFKAALTSARTPTKPMRRRRLVEKPLPPLNLPPKLLEAVRLDPELPDFLKR